MRKEVHHNDKISKRLTYSSIDQYLIEKLRGRDQIKHPTFRHLVVLTHNVTWKRQYRELPESCLSKTLFQWYGKSHYRTFATEVNNMARGEKPE